MPDVEIVFGRHGVVRIVPVHKHAQPNGLLGLKWDIGAYEYGSVPYIKGDLNGDGEVNVLDVQLCSNVILNRETDPVIVQKAKEVVAPFDECNILDLQEIVNIILRP